MQTVFYIIGAVALTDLAIVGILATAIPVRRWREDRWARQCAERVIARLHREGVR